MSDTTINIFYSSQFGSRGTGNSEFDYPTGICKLGSYIYIVDKQNHRIQYFDTNGTYVGQFGSFGTGNNNFSFPEDITTDGINLFIVDGANHRVKEHTSTGTYVSEFGTRGTGNSNFEYPVGIWYDGYLYIADKGNSRIKIQEIDGTFVNEISGLNYPEGVCTFGTNIIICDSGNHLVKVYETDTLAFSNNISYIFDYPTNVKVLDGVLCVFDKQNNDILFFDSNYNFIDNYDTNLSFPYSAVVADTDILWLVNYGSHEIFIYDFSVTIGIPIFSKRLLNLTKQLYPTGRAWWMSKNSTFEKFHNALAYSESRALSSVRNILNSIIPDNDNFSETDATNWERALGLINDNNTLENRKLAISRKMKYPGTVLARQSAEYIQSELQAAGFNVFVERNTTSINPIPANFDNYNFDQQNFDYDGGGALTYDIIANYLDETKEQDFKVVMADGLKSTFVVSGDPYPSEATVPTNRKREFRELLLRLKPAQTVGFMFIKYQDLKITLLVFAATADQYDTYIVTAYVQNISNELQENVTVNLSVEDNGTQAVIHDILPTLTEIFTHTFTLNIAGTKTVSAELVGVETVVGSVDIIPKEITLTTDQSSSFKTVGITNTFASGTISVDWGDGSAVQNFVSGVELTHSYVTAGAAIYVITISGELQNITAFQAADSNIINTVDLTLYEICTNINLEDNTLLAGVTLPDVLLTNLDLRNCDLTELDLSATNTRVSGVFNVADNSSLDTLIFNTTGNSTLTSTVFYRCNLTSVDLSNVPVSGILYGYQNSNLDTITFKTSGNGTLTNIQLYLCNFTTLDFTNVAVSTSIAIYDNPNLTTLTFKPSGNGSLGNVFLYRNSLTPVDFTVFPTSTPNIQIYNNAMTAAEVNEQLVNLDNTTWINFAVQAAGTNAAPDGTSGGFDGLTAKANLLVKGCTVTTN